MIIDYEDDGVIRWDRNGEKKHAELIDLIEAYEDKRKRGICEDCLFLDSHDDFTFACKKGKEIHDLNGTCDKWRSAYLRGEVEEW